VAVLPFPDQWSGLWSQPDGDFWLTRPIYCSGLAALCPSVEVITPTGGESGPHPFPVTSDDAYGPEGGWIAAAPDGSLWRAGHETDG
jgi:hypothetical protein